MVRGEIHWPCYSEGASVEVGIVSTPAMYLVDSRITRNVMLDSPCRAISQTTKHNEL